MAKKKTAVKSAKNRPGSRPAKDAGAPIFFYYKGARYELKIVNSVIRRFRKLGGDFEKAEEEPLEQATLLLMAVLKLEGQVEDHEDDFESILTAAPKIKLAMERYQKSSGEPGEPNGGLSAQSPESATA